MTRLSFIVIAIAVWAVDLYGRAPSLVLLLRPVQYLGHMYTAPPQDVSGYVVFADEPMQLQINIVNWSQEDQEVRVGTDDATLFAVTSSFEGLRTNLPITVDPSRTLRRATEEVPLDPKESVRLGPQEFVTWRLLVDTKALRPGLYLVEVGTTATDADKRPVFPQGPRVVFEVRNQLDSGPEVLRRRGLRHLDAKEWDAATAVADELLRVHPGSHAAYLIKAEAAEAAGRLPETRRLLGLAVAQLVAGRDTLFSKWARPDEIRAAIETLKTRATGQ